MFREISKQCSSSRQNPHLVGNMVTSPLCNHVLPDVAECFFEQCQEGRHCSYCSGFFVRKHWWGESCKHVTSYLAALLSVVVFQKSCVTLISACDESRTATRASSHFSLRGREGELEGRLIWLPLSILWISSEKTSGLYLPVCGRASVSEVFLCRVGSRGRIHESICRWTNNTERPPPPRCEPCRVDKSLFVFVKRSLERLGKRLQALVKSVSFHQQLVDILIKLSVQIKRIEPRFRSDWKSSSTRRKKKRRRRLEHVLIESFQEWHFSLSIVFSQ